MLWLAPSLSQGAMVPGRAARMTGVPGCARVSACIPVALARVLVLPRTPCSLLLSLLLSGVTGSYTAGCDWGWGPPTCWATAAAVLSFGVLDTDTPHGVLVRSFLPRCDVSRIPPLWAPH